MLAVMGPPPCRYVRSAVAALTVALLAVGLAAVVPGSAAAEASGPPVDASSVFAADPTVPDPAPEPVPADGAPPEEGTGPAAPADTSEPATGPDPSDAVPGAPALGGDVPAGDLPSEPPEADVPQVAGPDLVVGVAVTNRVYHVGESVRFTVTVDNVGPDDATGVRGTMSGAPFTLPVEEWGEFADVDGSPGGRIAAGETVVLELDATVNEAGTHPVVITLSAVGEIAPADNSVTVSVTAIATSELVGTIYRDRNGNGVADPGEGLTGVTVFIMRFHPPVDVNGQFRIWLPVGRYPFHFMGAVDGWTPRGGMLTVGPGPLTEVFFPAVPPLSTYMDGRAAFTADRYRPGQTATARLTLTNRGAADVTGRVSCNQSAHAAHLRPAPAWDQFDHPITVVAGGTRSFELTGTVPDVAGQYGSVFVECVFGQPDHPVEGYLVGRDHAGVPSGFVNYTVQLAEITSTGHQDRSGVVVGLIDPDTDRRVARAVTGPDGRAVFGRVASGAYLVRIYGPWQRQFPPKDEHVVFVGTCESCRSIQLYITAGPDVPEPRPAPPPQGGAGPGGGGLAETGVDVRMTSVLGVLSVAAGLALMVLARRRPTGRPRGGVVSRAWSRRSTPERRLTAW